MVLMLGDEAMVWSWLLDYTSSGKLQVKRVPCKVEECFPIIMYEVGKFLSSSDGKKNIRIVLLGDEKLKSTFQVITKYEPAIAPRVFFKNIERFFSGSSPSSPASGRKKGKNNKNNRQKNEVQDNIDMWQMAQAVNFDPDSDGNERHRKDTFKPQDMHDDEEDITENNDIKNSELKDFISNLGKGNDFTINDSLGIRIPKNIDVHIEEESKKADFSKEGSSAGLSKEHKNDDPPKAQEINEETEKYSETQKENVSEEQRRNQQSAENSSAQNTRKLQENYYKKEEKCRKSIGKTEHTVSCDVTKGKTPNISKKSTTEIKKDSSKNYQKLDITFHDILNNICQEPVSKLHSQAVLMSILSIQNCENIESAKEIYKKKLNEFLPPKQAKFFWAHTETRFKELMDYFKS